MVICAGIKVYGKVFDKHELQRKLTREIPQITFVVFYVIHHLPLLPRTLPYK